MQAEDPTMISSRNDPLFMQIAMSDSKAKMYCILRRLDVAQFDDLTSAEQVKMPLIKAYSEFKESEVWQDFEEETRVGHEHFLESIAENMHKDIAVTVKKGLAAIMTRKGMGHKL